MTAKGRSLAGSAAVVGAVALVGAPAVWADSTPVGKLPPPSVTTMTTAKGWLVSVTLPTRSPSTGLVWRIARPLDTRVVRQVGEADVGRPRLPRRRHRTDVDHAHPDARRRVTEGDPGGAVRRPLDLSAAADVYSTGGQWNATSAPSPPTNTTPVSPNASV